MKYVLGLDQGSSKTHAIVTDEAGRVLGMARSRGVCHSAVSLEAAMDAIEEAAEEALAQAGITRQEITCVAAGLTGTDWDFEVKLLENAVRKRLKIDRVHVVNDCIIAMRAGSDKEVTGVLCVGSGTNCAIRKGDELFVYGFYIPDEAQGGMCLGHKAVQAVFDAHVGLLPETVLEGYLLKHFGVETVDQLLYMRATHQIDEREYLTLPILLEQAAAQGDEVALGIWEEYGKTLAKYVTARMRLMGLEKEEIEIVLSGSIFKCRIQTFFDAVTAGIHSYAPHAAVKSAVYEPIVGAALLGLDNIFGKAPDIVYENLEKSARHFPIKR